MKSLRIVTGIYLILGLIGALIMETKDEKTDDT